MDISSNLLPEARSTALDKRGLLALANTVPVPALAEALSRALNDDDIQAATALALAIGAAGSGIQAGLAIRLIPDLEDMRHVPIIAGIAEGNRLAMLLDLVEAQRLSWEREALVLYLATLSLEGEEPPRRLLRALRMLAREPISPGAAVLVGLAARVVVDPEIDALTEEFRAMAADAERRGVHKAISAGFFAPVLDSLPEESPRMVSGYTVIRTEPKVGRNDPCHCGSGRKYKKCCAGKEHGLSRAPSRIEQFQKLASQGSGVLDQVFRELRPGELAQLEPARLTTIQLISAIRKFSLHRRWEAAERFMEALCDRADVPGGDPGEYRKELADEALRAGELDLAQRHIARSDLSEEEAALYRMQLALARHTPDALDQVESAAAIGHRRQDFDPLVECAFGLLEHFPAIGILAARGCISADRFIDSEMLLIEIDRARDRLDLSAREPWWEIFDLLLEDRLGPRELPRDGGSDREKRREQEIEEMRERLQAANSRVSRLDGELSRNVELLDALSREREQLAVVVKATQGGENARRISELEEETRRLRTKVVELKGEISEGASRRTDLRRELAKVADAVRKESGVRGSEGHPQEDDEDDEAEGDPALAVPRKILVPHYAQAAGRSLGTFPARVAMDALRETALLAGGDGHAWNGVKHMRRAREILSARAGRSYRILFSISDERLEVLDLVHRRDLDAAIQRLARR